MAESLSYDDALSHADVESGYASGSGSEDSFPDVYLTKPHLKFINQQLAQMEPEGKLPCPHSHKQKLTCIRYSKMVLGHVTKSLSNNSIWLDWSCNSGYALQDHHQLITEEQGRPHLS